MNIRFKFIFDIIPLPETLDSYQRIHYLNTEFISRKRSKRILLPLVGIKIFDPPTEYPQDKYPRTKYYKKSIIKEHNTVTSLFVGLLSNKHTQKP